MVRIANEHRHLGGVLHDDDVPDPFGLAPEVMDASFALIVGAVESIARVVKGEVGPFEGARLTPAPPQGDGVRVRG